MKRAALFLFCTVFVGSYPLTASAYGGDCNLETAVQKAQDAMVSKARHVKACLQDALGKPFKEQVDQALKALAEDGAPVEQQVKTCDLVLAWAAKIEDGLREAKKADLVSARDRVVTGYSSLAEDLEKEAERLSERSKSCQNEEFKERYARLSTACRKMSRGYKLRADRYEKIDLASQMVWVQNALEWLVEVQKVVHNLRSTLATIQADEAVLAELQSLSSSIAGIQDAIRRFSEIVEMAEIEGKKPPKAPLDQPQGKESV